jgi:hypothetical protein
MGEAVERFIARDGEGPQRKIRRFSRRELTLLMIATYHQQNQSGAYGCHPKHHACTAHSTALSIGASLAPMATEILYCVP